MSRRHKSVIFTVYITQNNKPFSLMVLMMYSSTEHVTSFYRLVFVSMNERLLMDCYSLHYTKQQAIQFDGVAYV